MSMPLLNRPLRWVCDDEGNIGRVHWKYLAKRSE